MGPAAVDATQADAGKEGDGPFFKHGRADVRRCRTPIRFTRGLDGTRDIDGGVRPVDWHHAAAGKVLDAFWPSAAPEDPSRPGRSGADYAKAVRSAWRGMWP
jgi:hypothetical protein